MKKTTKLFLMYALALMLVLAPNAAFALSLSSVVANDNSTGGDGVDSGDKLTITFDEDVKNTADVTTATVDDFFTLSGSKTWPSVSDLDWSGGSSGSGTLTITFGSTSGTMDKGDTLTPKTSGSYYLVNNEEEAITNTSKTIIGSFDRQWDKYYSSNYISKANDIFVDGKYAYVAAGSKGLLVLDVSTPGTMSYKSSKSLSSGDARGVYYSDGVAYVCNGSSGLFAVEVSKGKVASGTPKSNSTPRHCYDVYVDGDYAYIADGRQGLVIMQVDGKEIVKVVENGLKEWDGNVVDVFVDGNYAYLAVDDDDNGLVIVDISSPAALTEDSVLALVETDAPATGVFVKGDYAYVSIGSKGLQVFDISDPDDVDEVDVEDMVDDAANAVYISGSYAFIADGDQGIKVVKVSSGSINSSLEEEIDFPLGSDECVSVFVDGGWAYLACEGAGVISVKMDGLAGGSGNGPDYTDGDLYVYASYEGDDSDGSREKPYPTIQAALDVASKKDEIIVFPGTYEEDVTIGTSGITLTGVGPAFVTIVGDGDNTVTVDADSVTVKGFTVSGGDNGILVKKSIKNAMIKNNIVIDTSKIAVYVDSASSADVVNNTIVQNDGDAVKTKGTPTMDIRNNIFSHNDGYGLNVASSTNITARYNLFYENDDGPRYGISPSTGDRTGDPDFEDDSDHLFDWSKSNWQDDFKLGSDSNAEDYGDPSSTYNDNDGSPNDMGAYGGPDGQYDDAEEPSKASKPTASSTGLTVTLTWRANDENDLFGYYIKRSDPGTTRYTKLNDQPVIGAEYIDTVSAAGTYSYRIVPVDLFGDEGSESEVVTVTVAGATVAPFSDVPTSSEFYNYIMELRSAGIINGFGDGTFKPLRPVTRAEFLKMALNAAGLDSSPYLSQPSCFPDMVTTHPLKQYVCYAQANGYVSGVAGKFYPEREVSRFEAMKILLNVNLITNITATTSTFSDVILAEQIRYIQKGYELGLVSGYGNGLFGPNNNILRQESAKIVSNMRAYKGTGGIYTQNCSKTCTQMANCIEAYFQYRVCGGSNLDSDGDGIPCEAICAG